MRADQLNQAEAQQIILTLVGQGRLTEDEMEEIVLNIPTPEKRQLTEFVHLILCQEEDCEFEEEGLMEECWQLRYHRKWLKRTNKLMQTLDLRNTSQLFELFNRAQYVVKDLSQMELKEPKTYALALRMKQLVRINRVLQLFQVTESPSSPEEPSLQELLELDPDLVS